MTVTPTLVVAAMRPAPLKEKASPVVMVKSVRNVKYAMTALPTPVVAAMRPVRRKEAELPVAMVSSAPSLKLVMMVSPTHVERVMPIVQPLERVPPVATPMSVRNWNNVTTVLSDACGSCNADCSGVGSGATCGDGEQCPELEFCDDGFTDACGSCNADCSASWRGFHLR